MSLKVSFILGTQIQPLTGYYRQSSWSQKLQALKNANIKESTEFNKTALSAG